MGYTFIKKDVMENQKAFLYAELLLCDRLNPNAGKCINTGYCSPEDGPGIDIICAIKQ